MRIYEEPTVEERAELLSRPASDLGNLSEAVGLTMSAVRERGDEAIRELTARFDGVELANFAVTDSERAAAADSIAPALSAAIQTARDNIRTFHEKQFQQKSPEVETMPGVSCWREMRAIDKVGLYIPGGTAPLFSTVLMLAVPAKIAGCEEIVLCSPPNKEGNIHPAILYAADLCGVTKIFKIGGAQAIAAMTHGTQTVPKVYKLFGPGNAYVTVAKQLALAEGLAIDMPAGPSEVLVCADAGANAEHVAADLLAQAEHGHDSQVVLVVGDTAQAEKVKAAVERQLDELPRKALAAQSIENSFILVLKDRSDQLDYINAYAPEHLILSMTEPRDFAAGIRNAGSIFLGYYTPESVGDYASGTNHTLPTYGYARQYSGVSLDSFVKQITFQELTANGLRNLGPTVEVMAEAEQLTAHKLAVSLRLADLQDD